MLCEIMVYRSPQTVKNSNKFSNFKLEVKTTDACLMYYVVDWHHTCRTEMCKGLNAAVGHCLSSSVIKQNKNGVE